MFKDIFKLVVFAGCLLPSTLFAMYEAFSINQTCQELRLRDFRPEQGQSIQDCAEKIERKLKQNNDIRPLISEMRWWEEKWQRSSTDDESYELWKSVIGINEKKIYRFGEAENFWQMGETGPCGPSSEIHVDKGKEVGCLSKECDPSCPCGRFVEIWNPVFMQYNRQADGVLLPLDQTGVDTGMGLERLVMVLQKKDSIFHTDLFDYLIKRTEEITGDAYDSSSDEVKAAFHVLADHVRSAALLIADGCVPSNEGRGYVLRKIIRRAALFTRRFSKQENLLPLLTETFVMAMHSAFDNLSERKKIIIDVIKNEIERFAASLEQGQQIFDRYVARKKKEKVRSIDGAEVFKLYDTYGFPPELTRVMAHESSFTVDMKGFEKEMKKQQERSGKKSTKKTEHPLIPAELSTLFVGYKTCEQEGKVIFAQSQGESLWIVTDQSPFYVESGGQVDDSGWMTIHDHVFPVMSLIKGSGKTPFVAVELKADESAHDQQAHERQP